MTLTNELLIAGSVLLVGWLIVRALENGLQRIADRIDNNSRLLDRVGTKLDRLCSTIKGLESAAWHKLGGAPKLSEMDSDDID